MTPLARGDSWSAQFSPAPPPIPDTPVTHLASPEAWKPLHQHWAPPAMRARIQPGWARVCWSPEALVYDLVFAGLSFHNSARGFNERTWELGDVAEIFVEALDFDFYNEIHVTPENHRLQLRLPPQGIADVRAGARRLEEFFISDPDWVRSEVRRLPESLQVRVVVPAAVLGLDHFGPEARLRTAVCRYDCPAPGAAPQLSSTAPLSAPSFHQRPEWTRLALTPAEA